MTNKLSSLMLIVGMFYGVNAFAANVTGSEVKISSDAQNADIKNDIAIFEVNVEVIHGERRIQADRLEVHGRKKRGKNRELLVATGQPAIFIEQQSDGTTLKASAKEIRYDVAKRLLEISGNAEIYQAGQTINAEKITYDIDQQFISAERSKSDKSQRVHTVLSSPEKEKGDK